MSRIPAGSSEPTGDCRTGEAAVLGVGGGMSGTTNTFGVEMFIGIPNVFVVPACNHMARQTRLRTLSTSCPALRNWMPTPIWAMP